MTEWIETEKELPPCDGTYWVANNIKTDTDEDRLRYDVTISSYDGFGFIVFDSGSPYAYRKVRYWKPYIPLEKKYGKVTND